MKNKGILIGAGYRPKLSDIDFLKQNGYLKIIAADSGAAHCKKLGIIPDFIIGDFDSISKEVFSFFFDKSKILKISRQNDTDLEKCIITAIESDFSSIALMSVIGSRLDHSLSNLSLSLKYADIINLIIIHQDSILFPIKGKNEFQAIKNEIISIYSFSSDILITTSGLKYELNKSSLLFGKYDSISNKVLNNYFKIEAENGYIFLVRTKKVIKKLGKI